MPILKFATQSVKDKNSSGGKNEKGFNDSMNYYSDPEKTTDGVRAIYSYVTDTEKTLNDTKYITGLNGISNQSKLAQEQMKILRANYLKSKNKNFEDLRNDSRFLNQFVVSFDELDSKNLTYDEMHEFSKKIAKLIGGDDYGMFLCSHLPHTEKSNDYFHTHIIVCSYPLDPYTKNKFHHSNGFIQQKIIQMNELAKEYGYGTIDVSKLKKEEIKFSQNKSWYEQKKFKEGNSWKEQLKKDIDYSKKNSNSFDDFVLKMEKLGYDIRTKNEKSSKEYKTITYRSKDLKNKIRGEKLGEEYSKENLKKYFDLTKEEKFNYRKNAQEKTEKENEEKNEKKQNRRKGFETKNTFYFYTKDGKRHKINRINTYQKEKNLLEIELELSFKNDNTFKNKVGRQSELTEIINKYNIEKISELSKRIADKNIMLGKLKSKKKELMTQLNFISGMEKELHKSEKFLFNKYGITKNQVLKICAMKSTIKDDIKKIDKDLETLKNYSSDIERLSTAVGYRDSIEALRYRTNKNLKRYKEQYMQKQNDNKGAVEKGEDIIGSNKEKKYNKQL